MEASEPTTERPPPAEPPRSRWSGGRVVGLVLGSIIGLIGLALLLGGLALLGAYAFGRDDDGYISSDDVALESSAFAITTEKIDLGAEPADSLPDEILGDVRIRVTPTDRPVFVGIGRDSAVDGYLRGVNYAELTDFGDGSASFDEHRGRAPQTPPARQEFWVAEEQGNGEQVLNWDAEFGQWKFVVMNANASRGVSVDADAGVKLDWLLWVAIGLTVVGLVITAGAVLLILVVGRRAEQATAAT